MKKARLNRVLCVLMALLTLCGAALTALGEVVITISDSAGSSSLSQNREYLEDSGADKAAQAPGQEAEAGAVPVGGSSEARQAFIDGMLATAKEEYDAASGKARRAQYSGDIYVCKNFTVYMFRQNAKKYAMAEYPGTALVIPDNLPKKECTDYVYGSEWKSVSASDGNPFVIAAQFRYNSELSKEENREAAMEFMRQAQRGDYFQMAANYYYGVGAHSMVFTADYDPETDSVHWTDSNMKGEKRSGVRYGYIQYDAEKKIEWFVDAFCRKKYGATIYRLRDDIVYAQ